jgi:hypothetical protein
MLQRVGAVVVDRHCQDWRRDGALGSLAPHDRSGGHPGQHWRCHGIVRAAREEGDL